MKHMSLTRFQQIKRFLKVTYPEEEDLDDEFWWRKSKPLFDHFNRVAPMIYKANSQISLDEMRVVEAQILNE
jgi:hypothetical protein